MSTSKSVKQQVTSAISMTHSVRLADLVLVGAGLASADDQRQGAPFGVRGAVPQRRLQPFGRHYMTSAFDEAAVRQLVGRLSGHEQRLQSRADRSRRVDARSRRGITRCGGVDRRVVGVVGPHGVAGGVLAVSDGRCAGDGF